MIDLYSVIAAVRALLPTVVVVVLGGGALWFADRWLHRRAEKIPGWGNFQRELLMVGLSLVVLIALVLALPVTEATRGSLITLSLGYDIHHDEIEKFLIQAAGSAGLVEAFVRIRALGDFSVTYEVSGRLGDTKTFLGSKSALHRAVLDSLHRNGVEIVSPTFMNQRQIAGGSVFIPSVEPAAPADPTRARGPDTLVFRQGRPGGEGGGPQKAAHGP